MAERKVDLEGIESRIRELETVFERFKLDPSILNAFSSGDCTNGCTDACTHGCTNGCTGGGCLAERLPNDAVSAG